MYILQTMLPEQGSEFCNKYCKSPELITNIYYSEQSVVIYT